VNGRYILIPKGNAFHTCSNEASAVPREISVPTVAAEGNKNVRDGAPRRARRAFSEVPTKGTGMGCQQKLTTLSAPAGHGALAANRMRRSLLRRLVGRSQGGGVRT
jgi:hypothetical protein